MASLFDPSAFIAAERQQTLAGIAAPARAIAASCESSKPAENCHFLAPEGPGIATIATIAAFQDQHLIWTNGPALFSTMPRPLRLAQGDWNRLTRLANWIAEDWSQAAIQAGWHPLEFFGCNSDPLAGRSDRDGIVIMLFKSKSPPQVTSVTPDHVELTYRNGDVVRFRSFGPRGQAYLWDAFAMTSGP